MKRRALHSTWTTLLKGICDTLIKSQKRYIRHDEIVLNVLHTFHNSRRLSRTCLRINNSVTLTVGDEVEDVLLLFTWIKHLIVISFRRPFQPFLVQILFVVDCLNMNVRNL